MAFNPSSTLWLCKVDFDITYKDVRWFSDREHQQAYFSGKVVKTLSEYLTVRKTLPGGGMVSSVKVGLNIDTVRAFGINYMYYQNANHGNRIFYAFVLQVIYINDNTTELVFETDVYQTWMLDCEFRPSLVVREHHKTDKYFHSLTGEPINPKDFVYIDTGVNVFATDTNPEGRWGYLIGASEQIPLENQEDTENLDNKGQKIGGIYQGMYFYYAKDDSAVKNLVWRAEEAGLDVIQFITVIPRFSAKHGDFGIETGNIGSHDTPADRTIYIPNFKEQITSFNGYDVSRIKNKKLFTSPYVQLVVSNHNGEQAVYNLEDFDDPEDIQFMMYGDISANPSVTLIPKNYKGLALDYDHGISLTNFPQCAYNVDSYKLWLAKNQYALQANGINEIFNLNNESLNVASSAVGAVGGFMSGDWGSAAQSGIGAVQSSFNLVNTGIQAYLNQKDMFHQARLQPNRLNAGNGRSNLLTAIYQNTFKIMWRVPKYAETQIIDDFFTKYGYSCNEIKEPNIHKREEFSFVQTVDVYIEGGIPCDDMIRLKNIYNSGVTLWYKPDIVIGDYYKPNPPNNEVAG